MELVVDKGFLRSFFTYNSEDRHKKVFDDFEKFIKKLRPGFTLITDFKSLLELIELAYTNPLLEIIAKKNPAVVFLEDLKEKLQNINFYEQSCGHKLCLIDLDPKECSALEQEYGYSFICGKAMAYKWKPFLEETVEESLCITSKPASEDLPVFDSWSKLEAYKHPLNAVLIVDGYILSNKTNQSTDQNLKPLLKSILPKKKNKLPVDITIITEEQPKGKTFREEHAALERYLKEELPELNFNLSIVRYDRNLLYKLKSVGFSIHERRIITNYFWIEAGGGFNIMNDKGRVKDTGDFISCKFSLYGLNYSRLGHIMKGYKAYADIASEVYGSNKNRLLIN